MVYKKQKTNKNSGNVILDSRERLRFKHGKQKEAKGTEHVTIALLLDLQLIICLLSLSPPLPITNLAFSPVPAHITKIALLSFAENRDDCSKNCYIEHGSCEVEIKIQNFLKRRLTHQKYNLLMLLSSLLAVKCSVI